MEKNRMDYRRFCDIMRDVYMNEKDSGWGMLCMKWQNKCMNVNAKVMKAMKEEERESLKKKKELIYERLCEMSGNEHMDMVNVITETIFGVIKGYYNALYINECEGSHFLECNTEECLVAMEERCIRNTTINAILKSVLLDVDNMPSELLKRIVEVVPPSSEELLLARNENMFYDFVNL